MELEIKNTLRLMRTFVNFWLSEAFIIFEPFLFQVAGRNQSPRYQLIYYFL
jgi:hypothetical protein